MSSRKSRPASSPARIDHRARAAEAVRLRAEGVPYREIADTLGYASENAANKAVLALLRRVEHESADALRDLEVLRLDYLWRKTVRGIERSEQTEHGVSAGLITAAVRVSERRARLLGLDSLPSIGEGAAGLEVLRGEFLALVEPRSALGPHSVRN